METDKRTDIADEKSEIRKHKLLFRQKEETYRHENINFALRFATGCNIFVKFALKKHK